MVRLLFVQALYNLSDEDCEYQVLDRMSFQHFCRLDGALNIPDARTLWAFKQRLAQGGLGAQAVFDAVSLQLQQHSYIPARRADRRRQHRASPHHPGQEGRARSPQRRRGARGLERQTSCAHRPCGALDQEKYGKSFYGYKLLADRGYDAQANRELLQDKRLRDGIARRAKPGQERRQRLEARNKSINRIRARGEHVFAALEQLGGKVVRAMTLARNELAIALKCAAYNAKRQVWLMANDPPLAAR